VRDDGAHEFGQAQGLLSGAFFVAARHNLKRAAINHADVTFAYSGVEIAVYGLTLIANPTMRTQPLNAQGWIRFLARGEGQG
jgi:hypothetical protein